MSAAGPAEMGALPARWAPGRRLAMLAAAVVLSSCGGGGAPAPQDQVFERLSFQGWVASGVYVIRTQAEAQALADQGWRDAPPIIFFGRERPATAPAFPAVDYGSRLVLGVSQGQGNVCQNLLITRVVRTGDDLEVEYRVDPPYFSNVCGSPPPVAWNAFVAVPKAGGAVRFTLIQG